MADVVELEPGATHDLRRRVLRDHLPGSAMDHPEDHRPGTLHLGVVEAGGAVVACATVFPEAAACRPGSRAARLRGMAVDPARQGQGLGSLLLAGLAERARRDGFDVLWAHGRDSALDFYLHHGWQVVGEGFTSVGLPHHVVVLDL